MTPKSPILQTICSGGFINRIKTEGGVKAFNCVVYVIRLTPEALNDYWNSEIIEDRSFFESQTEFEEYKIQKAKARAELIADITEAIGIKNEGISFTNNVSEIFTVAQIKPFM